MKLKKAAIWGIAVVLLAGGIAAGAVVLNGRPETKDNLINMAKIIKPRGDKTCNCEGLTEYRYRRLYRTL
ncbi:MAG: hypothetical protein ACLR7D_07710 [Lachnospira eligens]